MAAGLRSVSASTHYYHIMHTYNYNGNTGDDKITARTTANGLAHKKLTARRHVSGARIN